MTRDRFERKTLPPQFRSRRIGSHLGGFGCYEDDDDDDDDDGSLTVMTPV
jgi:hypothetical protein